MKQKKIPMRSCVITREKLPKKELIRVVRTPEGNILSGTSTSKIRLRTLLFFALAITSKSLFK